jgi:hypothetical protein
MARIVGADAIASNSYCLSRVPKTAFILYIYIYIYILDMKKKQLWKSSH